MPYKLSGTKNETARIIILEESDWGIVLNETISGSGSYEFLDVTSGTKLVLARNNDGTIVGYGNVTPEEYINPITWATWNPDDTHSNVQLTEDNLHAIAIITGHFVSRSTHGKSVGKWYWELEVTKTAAGLPTLNDGGTIGVGTINASLSTYIGSTNSWGAHIYTQNNESWCYHNGSRTNTLKECAIAAEGDIAMLALDMDNGKLWIGKNGTWGKYWSNPYPEGDPVAGTYPAFTGITGIIYPMCGPYNAGQGDLGHFGYRTNFGTTPFTYTPPEGYSGIYS